METGDGAARKSAKTTKKTVAKTPPKLVSTKVRRHINRARFALESGQLGFDFAPSFVEARRMARAQNLTSSDEYLAWVASGKAPGELTPIPDCVYKDKWCGWYDFLVTPKNEATKKPSAAQTVPPRRCVNVCRYDFNDGRWQRGYIFPNIFAKWGRNLCLFMAQRVPPSAQSFFTVETLTKTAQETPCVEFRLERSDVSDHWQAIEFEAGKEKKRSLVRTTFHRIDKRRKPANDAEGDESAIAQKLIQMLQLREKETEAANHLPQEVLGSTGAGEQNQETVFPPCSFCFGTGQIRVFKSEMRQGEPTEMNYPECNGSGRREV